MKCNSYSFAGAWAPPKGVALSFPNPVGTNVLPFTSKCEARLARMGIIKTMRVDDDCLEGEGIFEGDEIICQTVQSLADINEQTICIVRILATNETVAARVSFKGSYITLDCCDEKGTQRGFCNEDIEIERFVLYVKRSADGRGRFDRVHLSIMARSTSELRTAVRRSRELIEESRALIEALGT